jgi:hypothetical protein
MSKHRVLSLKPQLRLERRGQDGQNEMKQSQSFRQFRRFHHVINSDEVFRQTTGTGRPSWMALIAALACDDLTIALGLLCSRLASVKP